MSFGPINGELTRNYFFSLSFRCADYFCLPIDFFLFIVSVSSSPSFSCVLRVTHHQRCGYYCYFIAALHLITDEVMQYSNAFSMWLLNEANRYVFWRVQHTSRCSAWFIFILSNWRLFIAHSHFTHIHNLFDFEIVELLFFSLQIKITWCYLISISIPFSIFSCLRQQKFEFHSVFDYQPKKNMIKKLSFLNVNL